MLSIYFNKYNVSSCQNKSMGTSKISPLGYLFGNYFLF